MDSQPVQDKAMHHLGQSRSSLQPDHALLTPDTFVRAPLPGMKNATAIIHAGPAMGADFTQYTAEIVKNGVLGPASSQRFFYVLDGDVVLEASGKKRHLAHGGFAFIPQGAKSRIVAMVASRVAVIEKAYQKLAGIPAPQILVGEETSVASEPLMGDADLQVRHLIPDEPAYDFAVNVMTYEPGAALAMVELQCDGTWPLLEGGVESTGWATAGIQ